MRYTTTDAPNKPLNAIQEGSLGDKMGIAATITSFRLSLTIPFACPSRMLNLCLQYCPLPPAGHEQ
jgi:hypothetical protein